MKTKDKTKKHIKLTIKNLLGFFMFVVIILYLSIFYNYYLIKNEVYAKETSSSIENFSISDAKEINIDEIIEENTKNKQKEDIIVNQIDLEYITKYQQNSQLPKGTMQVIQEGREGKQEITTKKTYKNGEIVSEEQVSSKITKASVDKIVEVGTGNYVSKYVVKAGDSVYITSDRLGVMVEPSEESQKVATLLKGKEVKVVKVENNWYKISSADATGYIKSESTTYMNPNTSYEKQEEANSNDITKLTFDIQLNKPSGLTLEQFKKVLSDSKDVNKVFEKNAEYFYYIEKQYNINGVFVASVGIHESAWGTSKISKEKNNLFGYGAYDKNPYNGAYSFLNYSESIDLIARVFVKYYLNPKGTAIYDGEKATGSYYNGATLTGINTRYATDKNWANGVYNHMKYLYNKL